MKYQPCFFPAAKPAGQGKESVVVLDVGLGATVLLGSHRFFGVHQVNAFFSKTVYHAKIFPSKEVHQVKAFSK